MLVLLPCRDQWSVQQWSCGPLLLWTVLCYGIVHKSPFCHAFQAVVAADPAHILRRGSHGSAVCHCWLNVEDCTLRTPSNTKGGNSARTSSDLKFLIQGNFFLVDSQFHQASNTSPFQKIEKICWLDIYLDAFKCAKSKCRKVCMDSWQSYHLYMAAPGSWRYGISQFLFLLLVRMLHIYCIKKSSFSYSSVHVQHDWI